MPPSEFGCRTPLKETITCKTVLIRKGASLSATWTTVATNGPVAALREPSVYRAHG
jgi:hypothetical protein